MTASPLYNARVSVLKENGRSRVIRVYPDAHKVNYLAGQYGSLGMCSEADPEKMVRRAYCISSSIVDLSAKSLIDHRDVDYYEFFFNRVESHSSQREPLTPKLFSLKDGDRIFCGEKIVGYYTLQEVPDGKNILLIGSTTGESPNNSLVNQLLRQGQKRKVCQVVAGPVDWESLYHEEQEYLTASYDGYKYRSLFSSDYQSIEKTILKCLQDEPFSGDFLGFPLKPESCHVFLAGDPGMIGPPKKKGGWEYEYPDSGLIKILMGHNFSIRTKFKEGTIEYECYW